MEDSKVKKLSELSQLYKEGILTREELEKEKQKIFSEDDHQTDNKSLLKIKTSGNVNKNNNKKNPIGADNKKIITVLQKKSVKLLILGVLFILVVGGMVFWFSNSDNDKNNETTQTSKIDCLDNDRNVSQDCASVVETVEMGESIMEDDLIEEAFKRNMDNSFYELVRDPIIKEEIIKLKSPKYYQSVLNNIPVGGNVTFEDGIYSSEGVGGRNGSGEGLIIYDTKTKKLDIIHKFAGRTVYPNGELYNTTGWKRNYYYNEFNEIDKSDPYITFPTSISDKDKICIVVNKRIIWVGSRSHYKYSMDNYNPYCDIQFLRIRDNNSGEIYTFNIDEKLSFEDIGIAAGLRDVDTRKLFFGCLSNLEDYSISMSFSDDRNVVINSQDYPDLRNIYDAFIKLVIDE